MRLKRRHLLLAAGIGISLLTPLIRADIVIDTITGVPTAGLTLVEYAEPQFGFSGFSLAARFTPSVSSPLTDAQVFVQSVNPGIDNLFDITIASDSNNLPGAPIEQIGTDLAAPFPGIVTANSITAPIPLVSGTPYWLEVTPAPGTQTKIGWFLGGSPTAAAAAGFADGTGWSPIRENSYQFRVDVLPEPSFALPLALCGCALLICRYKLRLPGRRQIGNRAQAHRSRRPNTTLSVLWPRILWP